MKNPFNKEKKTEAEALQMENSAAIKLGQGMVTVQDVIAPSAIEVDFDDLKINNVFFRTLFVAGYPRFVAANWLSPLINFDHSLDISMFVYPVDGKSVLDDLRRKIAEMEAEIAMDIERGKIVDPSTQAKVEDARSLQEQLVKGAERFFQFSLYVTLSASTVEELNHITKQVESSLGSLLIISKHATLQMEDGFKATQPLCVDKLMITRNMDTTSLATTFPFTSSELTANEGIMYGINEHNGSLIIFDRFSMENANSVIFAKSGAGKSYLVKLEALRSLMFGTEIIIIDPESEYKTLCDAIGGEFIEFSFNSPAKINPFDLSQIYEEGENELGTKLLSLNALFKIIMGTLNPSEDAILNRALTLTYKMKGITIEPATQKNEPPLMEDLYKALLGMEEPDAKGLSDRLEKFVKGAMSGIFDQGSNVNIHNTFTVFSIKNLEESLRPIAMFVILDYVWTKIRKDMKKRILIVDEAWYMMRYPDSAFALTNIAKRARKYWLGLTIVTQDVEDFLEVKYNDFPVGRAVINNSSIQILMKQSPASVDKVAQVFYLSEGEKNLLLSANVGEGLFFAGANHVRIRVVASPDEHKLITSKPEDLFIMQNQAQQQQAPAPQPEIAQPQQTNYQQPTIQPQQNPFLPTPDQIMDTPAPVNTGIPPLPETPPAPPEF